MKFALIEIGGSHDECLYSQLLFLNGKANETHLICSDNLKEQVSNFELFTTKYFFDFQSSKWQRIHSIYKLWRQIRKEKYDTVIFNTAQGSVLRSLMLLPYGKQTTFVGVMHNANKLFKSSSQQIISKKIKKYFVLNDYVTSIQEKLPHLEIASFYPIFFPEFKTGTISKPNDEIWICIPGQLQQKRRDYRGLINSLVSKSIPDNIKFLLLGRCTKENECAEIKEKIEKKGLNKNFVFWDKFIPNDEFYSYIQASDFIMPLVSAKNEPAYLTHKISGSFNLAFAYKKLMLMEGKFKYIEDFKENAVFYTYSSINEVLQNLDKELLTEKRYQNSKWNLAFQQRKYLEFINDKTD
jgi:glycosyltransferase involved in cell wall biosynthesis